MRPIIQTMIFTASAVLTMPVMANTFMEDLEQVDKALKTNPTGALEQSRQSCLTSRNHAVTLNKMGSEERARRALQYCFDSLRIPRVEVVKVVAPTQQDLEDAANKEYEKALTLEPDVANGLAIYRECAACHEPEGWGRTTGSVPQIAGQHRTVVIQQLADFRAGNRESVLMAPYATVESIGGPQALADVAEYISTLEISVENGKGPAADLERGKELYNTQCVECHGDNGQGSNDEIVPRMQSQHHKYVVKQLKAIRDGKRRNGSEEMAYLVEDLDDGEISAVADYMSRLQPAAELRAPAGWKNPDFE